MKTELKNISDKLDFVKLLFTEGTANVSAIAALARIRNAIAALEAQADQLKTEANADYLAWKAEHQLTREWFVTDFAKVATYTPKAFWEYPQEICRQESELKAAKKTAQNNGTAKKLMPTVNAATDTLFTLQIINADA